MTMIGMRMDEAKARFFDRRAVIDAVGVAAARNLGRAGQLVRNEAIKSIKDRKGTSPPGGAPFSHVGQRRAAANRKLRRAGKQTLGKLRGAQRGIKFILYAFEPSRTSVVVGPLKLHNTDGHVPRLLEMGGSGPVVDPRTKKSRTATFRPRPYMGPALAKESPQFAGLWANTVK